MPGNASLSPKLRTALRKPCSNTQWHVDDSTQLLVTMTTHTRNMQIQGAYALHLFVQ
jgi:hypothetical protein